MAAPDGRQPEWPREPVAQFVLDGLVPEPERGTEEPPPANRRLAHRVGDRVLKVVAAQVPDALPLHAHVVADRRVGNPTAAAAGGEDCDEDGSLLGAAQLASILAERRVVAKLALHVGADRVVRAEGQRVHVEGVEFGTVLHEREGVSDARQRVGEPRRRGRIEPRPDRPAEERRVGIRAEGARVRGEPVGLDDHVVVDPDDV